MCVSVLRGVGCCYNHSVVNFRCTCDTNWASEASPTLGCSIEILRDIYMYVCMYISVSVVCQINCVGGITWPTRMLKVIWAVRTDP